MSRDDEANLLTETAARIPLRETYGQKDTSHPPEPPGEFPFTRGIHAHMYRDRLWTMRQYAGFGDAAESNRRYRYLLEQGQTGLSVAFDLPTQMGRDPDHPLATGEVGRAGVSIASLSDMETLFDKIPLDRVSTSMTINSTAATLLALYVAVADARGIPRSRLRGTIQNDILKEYIARGTYIYPPRPSMRLIVDTFAFCKAELPQWNTISISGYHIREAGSDAVQEVAFTLADGCAYVQAALDAGLSVDEFGQRLSFFFNVHNNLIEEVAKFRAARRLWAKLMRERFGAREPRACMLRFHAQTAGSMLTAQQPHTNLVRVTVQALAAVLGGAQSLHCNAFDEALALPTEDSARLALRTQQLIADESGVANVADPLGGAWAIEALTDEIEERARQTLARIDEMGGMLAAIERGWVQREIARRAYEWQRSVEDRRRIVVGVNRWVVEEAPFTGILRIDPEVGRRRAAEVAELRASRDPARHRAALDRLRRAAGENVNLVPPILESAKALATVGEIADELRAVWGEYRETVAM